MIVPGRARRGNQVAYALDRIGRGDDDDVGADRHERYGRQVAARVERQLRDERRIGADGRVRNEQGVAVRLGAHRQLGGDDAAGPAPVVHHELHPETLAELLPVDARGRIGIAAGRLADDEADRTRGIPGSGIRGTDRLMPARRNAQHGEPGAKTAGWHRCTHQHGLAYDQNMPMPSTPVARSMSSTSFLPTRLRRVSVVPPPRLP